VDTVPWTGPYLAADPALAAENQTPFAAHGLRVGIAWAGNPKYKADHRRSMHLATLVELLRSFSANWISLQKGVAADQLADVLPNLPPGVRLHDGSSHDADLAETAALIATLDLVITTDTSIAHLAGALGKPVWILLPHQADWRWMQQIETTPWYPTARLFRQPTPGNWSAVFARVSSELRRMAFPALRAPAA
jgi:ADP-heptose:LPS heptosyltransferase